ncbi:hypothetical protein SCHPADRAFT_835990 [Schizopora paradoxa]|uniref:DnaJ homologue subfamily C member 28 conserved domain-containing protein n=1 Tax=Schizopora paradoxa TaxID=27342 RepID=A0A0H2RSX6_9AGAM|nr:hypothetical protein SCHPADRAFT_835990 [Schizopora paradoxa]
MASLQSSRKHSILFLRNSGCRNARLNSSSTSQRVADHRASSKLFADAAAEESDTRRETSRASQLLAQQTGENWDGEERIQDAVLRMLVDKYKPLRTSEVRSADEKLQAAPPTVLGSSSSTFASEDMSETDFRASLSSTSTSDASPMEHKPWLVTFKPPSHAMSVKLGRMPPTSSSRRAEAASEAEGSKKPEPSARRRSENAQRLGRARESLLDYKLGIRGAGTSNADAHSPQRRPAMPVSMRGLTALVEEKIERARQEGHFKTIKGRGKPFQHETAESNPFIAREEFLMNRIVQRNGAAPPWVDLQAELEEAVTSFRGVLLQSWTRRAVRMLTSSRPSSELLSMSLDDCKALRDSEWETRERAYHDIAINDVNTAVRRYNGVAPYPIRRALYDRSAELKRVYENGAEEILKAIRQRVAEGSVGVADASLLGDEEGKGGLGTRGGGSGTMISFGFWDMVRSWFAQRRA